MHILKLKNAALFMLFLIFAFLILPLRSDAASGNKEITIIYAGQTHAMLYTCSCPKEQDGGIARRATLVKQLRKDYPDAILVDAGSFFAGGLEDEYTQNTQLDMQRTDINLKAMDLMKFDVAVIGPDEFNFGSEFLQDKINKIETNFVSSNIKMTEVAPFIMKEVSGAKIGMIGVTSMAAKQKAGAIEVSEPNLAVTASIAQLKKAGANVIVLLSNLGSGEEQSLIENVKGVDILVSNNKTEAAPGKAGMPLVLRTSWQGRKLGKLTFSVKDNLVVDPKSEEIRLSDKLTDDPGVAAILPRCFSDRDCKKQGLIGACNDAGAAAATCSFLEPSKVSLTVITSKTCVTCNTDMMIQSLKKLFPGVEPNFVYYPDKKAEGLIKELGITGLPAYILGKDVEKDKGFDKIKANTEAKGDYFLLKPESSGVSFFINREKQKGKFDIFLSLYDDNTAQLLNNAKEFKPAVHFLVVEVNNTFDAPKGKVEVEDDTRAVCVQKYYPDNFIDYLSCRAQNKDSSWWEDCAGGLDITKIKACAKGEEGTKLLRENIALSKQLRVMYGPAYLLDNQEIFSSKGAPTKEEFKKILKR